MAVTYNPIGSGEFTKAMLDNNFRAISEASFLTDESLQQLGQHIVDLSQTVAKVAKSTRALEQKSQRSYFWPVVIGGTVAYYGYKKLKASKVDFSVTLKDGTRLTNMNDVVNHVSGVVQDVTEQAKGKVDEVQGRINEAQDNDK